MLVKTRLYGLTCAQTFWYYQMYSEGDAKWVKLLVRLSEILVLHIDSDDKIFRQDIYGMWACLVSQGTPIDHNEYKGFSTRLTRWL
jgi:hypothetical protein